MTVQNSSLHTECLDEAIDQILATVGKRVVLGTPLALGKPNHLLNALYQRAVADPTIQLILMTGLSLSRPTLRNELERRFAGPIVERIFGNAPELDYVTAYMADRLPANIEVAEFFLNTGKLLGRGSAQRHYLSSNYSLVGRDMMIQGCNVFAQSVAKQQIDGQDWLSVSSNSDSLDLHPLLREKQRSGEHVALVAQVNRQLPFMPRDAMVKPETFDIVLDHPSLDHDLLGPPSPQVGIADHAIGLNAAALIKDGGTLQIGIGSLGDAIAASCCLRHRDPTTFKDALDALGTARRSQRLIEDVGGTDRFREGLYGSTEMFCDGYRHLYQAGILKREVFDDLNLQTLINNGHIRLDDPKGILDALVEAGAVESVLNQKSIDYLQKFGIVRSDVGIRGGQLILPDGEAISTDLSDPEARAAIEEKCLGDKLLGGTILHAGFFLGPKALYQTLHDLGDEERRKFCMTSIRYVNELYGHQELATAQRRHARFMNTTMIATLLGAVCSDGLDSGQVVSGVGGQYNFVAMAHALEGSRSILMLRSTRSKAGQLHSNLVWNYGHITIPRHLRDIVITEYGIANLRGRQDQQVIAALLEISDSRFQEDLRQQAVSAGKLKASYRIPDECRRNTPERLRQNLKPFHAQGLFQPFPFGSDLSNEEQVLAKVLNGLKSRIGRKLGTLRVVADAVMVSTSPPHAARAYLERLGLDQPRDLKETMLQRVVLAELQSAGIV